ncbi:serine/threonine protein kinase [Brevibacillus choshinensis]|uniref:serine/threonine protein kinase n=1 Tax=Brevibacillus choshinensis TaxID=54911 RepID=UPI002E1EA55C|nr:serine/threonine protein kinase [Brevibacillus choshinensis]MED4784492.1 serine/threonine protein kinase [Brevibacillus choshinensis]
MRIDQHVLQSFLQEVKVESQSPDDPVVVLHTPYPWELVGTGNYAAVFAHPDYPSLVIKLYAPGRPGWEQEVEVYRRLGETRSFPICYHSEESYLVLKRINGISLFDCIRFGIPILPQVIEDVEEALSEARRKGLFPHDVHGKNVLMDQGRGYLIDVSDYYKNIPDSKWKDLRKAYYRIYLPFLKDRGWKIPLWVLDAVRKGYRWYKKGRRLFK